MGKRLIRHMYNGFMLSMFVSMIVEFTIAQLTGHCVTPGFAARFNCEAAAVLAQLGLVSAIGMTFAGAALSESVVFGKMSGFGNFQQPIGTLGR